jgi:hypothetical protein
METFTPKFLISSRIFLNIPLRRWSSLKCSPELMSGLIWSNYSLFTRCKALHVISYKKETIAEK